MWKTYTCTYTKTETRMKPSEILEAGLPFDSPNKSEEPRYLHVIAIAAVAFGAFILGLFLGMSL